MNVSGIGPAGMLGIQRGADGLARNAAEIASAGQMDGSAGRDLAQPLVEQRQNLEQVQASTKVLKAGDDMIGTLLDVMA